MTRRWEFIAGSSAKFYEICIRGAEVMVNYGRIGPKGSLKPKRLHPPKRHNNTPRS